MNGILIQEIIKRSLTQIIIVSIIIYYLTIIIYHNNNYYKIIKILDSQTIIEFVFMELITTIWPEGFNSNTPKEVLLIHEIEKLIEMLTNDEFDRLFQPFLVIHFRFSIFSYYYLFTINYIILK